MMMLASISGHFLVGIAFGAMICGMFMVRCACACACLWRARHVHGMLLVFAQRRMG